MSRRQRRAKAAANRKPLDRAEVIRFALDHLAISTDPTVTGATLIMPDGSMTYLSAGDAQAPHGEARPGGQA